MAEFSFFCCKCGTTTFSSKPLDRIFALWCRNKGCHELLVQDYHVLANSKETQVKPPVNPSWHHQKQLGEPGYFEEKYAYQKKGQTLSKARFIEPSSFQRQKTKKKEIVKYE